MLKLQRLMNEKNLTPRKLGYYSGSSSKMYNLDKVLRGEASISSLPYSTLETISRLLGITVNDILDDFDENGISGQIETIERTVDRVRNRIEGIDSETVRDKNMIIQIRDSQIRYNDSNIKESLDNLERHGTKNKIKLFKTTPPFAFLIFNDKLEGLNESLSNPVPYLKTEYEFINTARLNSNSKSAAELNREYIDNKLNVKDNSVNINRESKNTIGNCPAMFIYTPFENGGDLKVGISVTDNGGNFKYSEVYGCEWINSEASKDIVYYKSQFFEPFNPSNIQNCYKERISEVEFYRSFQSQFAKFKISK